MEDDHALKIVGVGTITISRGTRVIILPMSKKICSKVDGDQWITKSNDITYAIWTIQTLKDIL